MINKTKHVFLCGIAVSLLFSTIGFPPPAQGLKTKSVTDSYQGVAAIPGSVYAQPPDPTGGYYNASENGMDYDEFVWDDFTFSADQTITEIHWRGAYDPSRATYHQPLGYFTVAIYPSIAGGFQPDVAHLPSVEYQASGNAGETPAGTFGGVVMYDYAYVLPTAFPATGGVKYWIYLEAFQAGVPDWCIAKGTGGNGTHFHGFINYAGGTSYDYRTGDTAFELLGPVTATNKIFLPFVAR